MEVLADGVYQSHVPAATLPPYTATQCYWVGSPEEMVLIDSGDGSPEGQAVLEEDWRSLGSPPVRAVLATHYHADHTGGGAWAARRFKAPLYLHGRDIEHLRGASEGERWMPFAGPKISVGGLDVHIIEAPGHTPGQCNFWLPDARVLLAGDNVLGNTTVFIGPPDGDLGRYMATLSILKGLPARVIGPGHGDLVRDPEAYLSYYLAHREERSRQLLQLIDETPLEPRALAETIYQGQLQPHQMMVGEWMVRGHLSWFLEKGLVREENGLYRKV